MELYAKLKFFAGTDIAYFVGCCIGGT